MALTRTFRETVYQRAQRDGAFRKALLTEAVNAYLGGDEASGKAILRDVINATVGFEQLAIDLQKPSKSLHRMLGPTGNPSTANFFAILQVLQKRVGTKLIVKADARATGRRVAARVREQSEPSNKSVFAVTSDIAGILGVNRRPAANTRRKFRRS